MAVNKKTVKSLMRISKNAYRKAKTQKIAGTEKKDRRKSKNKCIKRKEKKQK